jgi:hypothetical protein
LDSRQIFVEKKSFDQKQNGSNPSLKDLYALGMRLHDFLVQESWGLMYQTGYELRGKFRTDSKRKFTSFEPIRKENLNLQVSNRFEKKI